MVEKRPEVFFTRRVRADDVFQHAGEHYRVEPEFPRDGPGCDGAGQLGEDAEFMKCRDGMSEMERFDQVDGGQPLRHERHRVRTRRLRRAAGGRPQQAR